MSSLEKLKEVASDKILLYIESDKVLQKNFGIYLQRTFKKFYQAYDGKEGFELFLKAKPDVVVMDLDLSKKDAIELIIDMKEISNDLKVITLSDSNDNYTLLQSLDMQLSAMMIKPINFTHLASKLISFLPVAKKDIPKKVLVSNTKQEPKKEPEPKKELIEKKVVATINKPKLESKPVDIIKKVKSEPKILKKETKTEPKVELKIPKTCMEDIQELGKKKETLLIINSYKGITIQNKAVFISNDQESFELQTTAAQIVAAKYEKHVVLKNEKNNKYIYANIININLKNNRLKLLKPTYINYQQRDKSVLRLTADKSFKATMFFDKTHIEFNAKQISLKYLLLNTDILELNIKPNMKIDLTLGFEVESANALIKDKKFTKTFAKGRVIRVDKSSSGLNIALEIEIQKSGQSDFLKYLKQRENETVDELKRIIKR